MRYLGIDYGSVKTGLALSDEAGHMGFPHAIILTKELESYLANLLKTEKIDAVVIGESKNFIGADNPIASAARDFARWVETQGLPVFWEPEVLTSAEARRAHEPGEKTRAPKERGEVDASAAALILTSYLSRHDHH